MSDDVEHLAELLSWTSGEFTRYSETAHPDHNRWSWRGDGKREGHGEGYRETFIRQARLLIEQGVRLKLDKAYAGKACEEEGEPVAKECPEHTEGHQPDWFDRTICAGCNGMHYGCECGATYDPCSGQDRS